MLDLRRPAQTSLPAASLGLRDPPGSTRLVLGPSLVRGRGPPIWPRPQPQNPSASNFFPFPAGWRQLLKTSTKLLVCPGESRAWQAQGGSCGSGAAGPRIQLSTSSTWGAGESAPHRRSAAATLWCWVGGCSAVQPGEEGTPVRLGSRGTMQGPRHFGRPLGLCSLPWKLANPRTGRDEASPLWDKDQQGPELGGRLSHEGRALCTGVCLIRITEHMCQLMCTHPHLCKCVLTHTRAQCVKTRAPT